MSKKIFTFLFALMMVLTLTACSKPGVITISVETNMTAGQTYQVEFTQENLDEEAVITWSVSDPTVAALNQATLKIEALKQGTFTLSASAEEGEVTASVEITVQPKPLETYTISYDLAEGQWGTEQGATSFIENSPATLVNPVREGYIFLGWYEGETKVETLTNKNYTLVAKWEKEKVYYTVSYSLNGGSWDGASGETQFEENNPFTLPTPVKEGFEFLGWYEGETKVEALENKNYELVAKWEEIIVEVWYDLEFELNGGAFAAGAEVPTTFLEGSELVIPVPTKEGYTFLGWKTYESSKNILWNVTNTNSDLKLFAAWGDAKFYVGANWGYTTLQAAVDAAQDGDTIVVMPGTYAGAEINKSVTIEAFNWLTNLSTEDYDTTTVFNTDLVFAADDITVKGVVISEAARFTNKINMSIANPTIKFSVVRNSTTNSDNNSWNAPFVFTAVESFEVTNLTILNCRIEDSSKSRPMIATLTNVNGLTIKGCEFLAHQVNYNDGIKARIPGAEDAAKYGIPGVEKATYGVKGDVTITGNVFSGYAQYVMWFYSYGAGNYVIENNEFETIGSTPGSHACATFVKYAGSESEQVKISMKYNKVNASMMLFRMDTADALTDTNADIDINYNSMVDCTGEFYVKNGTAVTLDVENNWWGTINLEATKFNGAAVPTAFYQNEKEVPAKGTVEELKYTIEYDLNGGQWDVMPYSHEDCVAALIADISAYYGKELTAETVADATYGLEQNMGTFFLTDETYSAKWKWLADYMMATREVDATQSAGYANLVNGDNTTWRFEVYAFANYSIWEGWPYSSDYRIVEVQENYTYAAAAAGKGSAVAGPAEYIAGIETKLNAGIYEGKVFQYWLNEDGQIFTDVIPATTEGNLKLKAVYVDEVIPTAFDVTNVPTKGIALYDTYQLQWRFTPLDTYNQELVFTSGDEEIFTVDKNGLITAVGVGETELFVSVLGNSDLDALYTIKVYIPAQFKVEYETESYVKPGETIQINAVYVKDEVETTEFKWESLNPEIATVENGTVTGVAEGVATIRVTLKDDATVYYDIPVTVIPATMSEVLTEILNAHESNVFVKYDLGIGSGTPDYYYDVYGSVNKILFNDPLTIDDKYLEAGNAKYEDEDVAAGKPMTNVEFITVHYTGNMSKTADAAANAGYFVQGYDEHTTSIHFTTGNDGVYQCMDTNKTAAHAGDTSSTNGDKYTTDPSKVTMKNADGTPWEGVGAFEWLDTGVAYAEGASLQPVVTVSDDYYYEIDGKKTTIKLPDPYSYKEREIHTYTGNGKVKSGTAGTELDAENYFSQMGFKFIAKDGKYFMAKTWWCYTQVSEGRICSVGGNSNSIGIESCVNRGSDLWWTWQRTAQLVAKLMKDNNLDLNRVVGHHFYTAKDCPQPMLENDMEIWYEFLALVEVEYALLTKYADYEIAMEVVSGEGLANNGRVAQAHEGQIVTYKVTVTNKTTKASESITLSSTVAGDYFK